MPGSASEAVQQGQQAFDKAEYDAALQLFSRAMTMRPNDDEARAALYNGACAKAKLKDWQGAAHDVITAVNDYKLKLEVAVKVRTGCMSPAVRKHQKQGVDVVLSEGMTDWCDRNMPKQQDF